MTIFTQIVQTCQRRKQKGQATLQPRDRVVGKDSYDLQFKFSSLEDFGTGFEIIDNIPKELKGKKSFQVGVLGNFSTGKSYILSKILGEGIELEQGLSQSTKGINFKFKQDKENLDNLFAFIDLPGLGEHIQPYKDKNGENNLKNYEANQKMEYQLLQQQVHIDCFIQEYILNHCNILIVTMDIMNREDHKFVTSILSYMKEKQDLKLFIVHNFKSISEFEDLIHQIQKDIQYTFPIEEVNKKNLKLYLNYTYNEKHPIIHLPIAKEDTEAGKKYNEHTIKFIREEIKSQQQKLSQIEIFEDLKKYIKNSISKYLQFDDEQSAQYEITFEKDPKAGENQFYIPQIRDHYEKNEKKLMYKEILFDAFGRPLFNVNETQVKFEIKENSKGILVLLQLPGLDPENWEEKIECKAEVRTLDNKNKLFLKIKADIKEDFMQNKFAKLFQEKRENPEEENKKLVINPINYGIQNFRLHVSNNWQNLIPSTQKLEYTSGILQISYLARDKDDQF